MAYRLNQDVDSLQLVGGIFGGAMAAAEPDLFGAFLVILIVATAFDWVFGRRAAIYRGDYSRARSKAGLHSKGGTLVILILLRVLEGLLPRVGLPEYSGNGIAASVIALALIVDELESIEDHVVALGGKRLPIFGLVFAKIRAFTGASRRTKPDDTRAVPPVAEERRG